MQSGEAIRNDHPCRIYPTLTSAHAIQVAATQVLHELRLGRITLQESRVMMNLVRLANNLLKKPIDFNAMIRTLPQG